MKKKKSAAFGNRYHMGIRGNQVFRELEFSHTVRIGLMNDLDSLAVFASFQSYGVWKTCEEQMA